MPSSQSTFEPCILLNEVRAADFLNLSVRTLQAWRNKGVGPAFVRAGRAIRYRPADLVAWIDANTVTPSAKSFSSVSP
jgi:hypothetical protein